ncbi:MAG: thiol reductant ABC exporter subunit CydD [Mycobacteriaceae bacterium]|nr:thiol reductant ABC exporter subunit CydD [Mycobacteriaceae bacterium]
MGRPLDPRLWRYSAPARRYLLASVGLSALTTASIVLAALALARVAAGVVTRPDTRTVGAWAFPLGVLAAAIGVRAAATWWQARLADRAGASVVADLETQLLAAATARQRRDRDPVGTAVLATTGLAGLRGYLTGYLPALMLACAAPPVVLCVIALHDPVSGGIIAGTLPLIPAFMILIGLLSRGKADASLAALTRLADQMLDLFAGLPTLRALGRQWGPQRRVAELGAAHRRTTMSALRVAFLSALVLELLATLCVALVAVSIGLRLVFGHMALESGLVALILAPEVYLPLRAVGERFHAAEDGVAAAAKAFAVLDAPQAQSGRPPEQAPGWRPGSVVLADVTVHGRDGAAPDGLSAELRPGVVTVLTGPNGSGKSTALQAVLGLVRPDRGQVRVGGVAVADIPEQQWWARVAWLPQRPVLVPGTLRHNVELFGAVFGPRLDSACTATGFDEVLAGLADGWDTVVGAGGVGLSLGQCQRLALTRVLAAARPVLLLDEPTAHLDPDSESAVLAALIRRAAAGDTVVLVGHRPAVLAAADIVVEVSARAAA